VGAYSAPPEPQAEFGGRRGKERERRQKEGGEGARVAPPLTAGLDPPLSIG